MNRIWITAVIVTQLSSFHWDKSGNFIQDYIVQNVHNKNDEKTIGIIVDEDWNDNDTIHINPAIWRKAAPAVNIKVENKKQNSKK